MQKNKKIIGLVPDYDSGSENSYSLKPYYAIRCNYIEMLSKFDAIPILFPYDFAAMDYYLQMIDGIMLIGGDSDIDPAKYGIDNIHPKTKLNKVREDFEFEIAKKALEKKIPFLGICYGMQLLNILYGGDLIQHIPDEEGFINHEQSKVLGRGNYQPYHEVEILQNSKLYQISGQSKIKTNSSHHQGIRNIGNGLVVSARASEDGMIEAIEDPNFKFRIGIQWHPEFDSSEVDAKIFHKFVESCK